jgi:hypothetical protein
MVLDKPEVNLARRYLGVIFVDDPSKVPLLPELEVG